MAQKTGRMPHRQSPGEDEVEPEHERRDQGHQIEPAGGDPLGQIHQQEQEDDRPHHMDEPLWVVPEAGLAIEILAPAEHLAREEHEVTGGQCTEGGPRREPGAGQESEPRARPRPRTSHRVRAGAAITDNSRRASGTRPRRPSAKPRRRPSQAQRVAATTSAASGSVRLEYEEQEDERHGAEERGADRGRTPSQVPAKPVRIAVARGDQDGEVPDRIEAELGRPAIDQS